MPNSPDIPIHLEGQLLLADPSLHDGVFNKAVIYLAEHTTDDGAYGLILNHPTDQTVGNVLPSDEYSALKDIRVYLGGPINQEQLTFAAFSVDPEKSTRLAPRISANNAIQLSQQPGTIVRAFAGHAEWTAGQLENELRQNTWITIHPGEQLLTNNHEKDLWAKLLRNISPYHQILAETPDDIFTN